MRQTRGNFVLSAALLPSSLALPEGIFAAQNPPTPPAKPQPGYTPNPPRFIPCQSRGRKASPPLENEKEFRLGVQRLYQLTCDLRNEVEKSRTGKVFSLHIVKEAEEIAKLAKSLKSKARAA